MKRILLVADQPGWVFERHCKEIKKRLTEYEINIAFHRQDIDEMSKKYDLVYALDPMPMRYPPKEKTIMGLRCEFLFREHPGGPIALYKYGFPGRCVSIRDHCCIFHVVNRNMVKVFEPIVKDIPLLLVQHGVNENLFDPQKINLNSKRCDDILMVSTSGRGSSNKGFDIVNSVCSSMKNVKNISAQYGRLKRSIDQMPSFYLESDVHVCMSKTEGLSNPILEAGAMGIPVISTRCGAAEEIIRDDDTGLLIDRTEDALRNAFEKMRCKEYRIGMGKNIKSEIDKNWTWKVRIDDFRNMFELFFRTKK